MICISVSESNIDNIVELIKDADIAEIRLDLIELSDNDIKKIFSQNRVSLIATCREGKYSDVERVEILKKAIDAGAKYLDIEIETSDVYKKELISYAKKTGCKIIISYHNYEETPEINELIKIINNCYSEGADIAKVACMTNSRSDAARILSLYDTDSKKVKQDSLVAIGMGQMGKITRIVAPILGSPFTFASSAIGDETASGQIEYKTLKNVLNLLTNL